jgi:prepilin-type N-terminal cleavage/methylation domain-containing protein
MSATKIFRTLRSPKPEKAFSLIEVLIATAILGIFVVVLISGLSTSSKALIVNDSRQTAKNVAESQMEFVKKAPYAFSYSLPTAADPYYTSTVNVSTLSGKGANIQKITIDVMHAGTLYYSLEGYKVN